jgi:hypothetical protein
VTLKSNFFATFSIPNIPVGTPMAPMAAHHNSTQTVSQKHIKFHDFIFMVRSSSNENVQVMLQNIGKYTKYKRLIWFSVSHNTGFAHIPAASPSHL